MKKIFITLLLSLSTTVFAQMPYFECAGSTVYSSGAKLNNSLYFSVYTADFAEWVAEGYKVRVEKFNDGRPFTLSITKEDKLIFSEVIKENGSVNFDDENFSTTLECRVEVPT